MVIHQQIGKFRKKRGLTQDQLAEKCEVTRQAVAKWESGESVPDIENILRLADIYQVSLDCLIRGYRCEMSPKEVHTFIKVMEMAGESWSVEEVEQVYQEKSLSEAIEDRLQSVNRIAEMIRQAACREREEEKEKNQIIEEQKKRIEELEERIQILKSERKTNR